MERKTSYKWNYVFLLYLAGDAARSEGVATCASDVVFCFSFETDGPIGTSCEGEEKPRFSKTKAQYRSFSIC